MSRHTTTSLPMLCLTVLAALLLPTPAAAVPRLKLHRVARVQAPVWVGSPRGNAHLFAVEQRGRILVWDHGRRRVFLDIRDRVATGGEQGLLSVAFHWNYRTNHRFYVYFTNARGHGRVVQFRANGLRAVKRSARLILDIDLGPERNHNGGMLWHTSANDLYIGVGDGGGAGDPDNSAQNRRRLTGKLLRIRTDAGFPYTIPPGNPYGPGSRFRREIYALGLRNPWRFSVDPVSHDIHIADVGQGMFEEVDRLPGGRRAGANFGWRRFEGRSLYAPGTHLAKGTRHRRPVQVYRHSASACSITGGLVYRGRRMPSLRGYYLYADLCGTWIRGMRRDGRGDFVREVGVPGIVHFGAGRRGEVFVASVTRNAIYRLGRQG